MSTITLPGLDLAKVTALPGVYNFGATLLPKWKKQRGLFRNNGTVVPKIGCSGDSTTEGAYSDGTTYGKRANGYPDQLATVLSSLGLLADGDSAFGIGGGASVANQQTYNPKLSGGAGWLVNGNQTLGGNIWESPSGVTAALNYTPSFAWDTAEIRVFDGLGSATWSASVNGGAALQTVTPNGDFSYRKVTISTGAGPAAQTLNIQRVSGGSLFLCQVRCYDSTKKRIAVQNYGRGGWRVGNGAANSSNFSPIQAITAQANDVNIIDYGINDWNAGTSLSSFNTAYQSVLTAAGGSQILLIPPASDPGSFASDATQQTYRDAIMALGQSNACVVVDWNWLLGSTFAAANANGFMGDSRHQNGAGNDVLVAVLAALLTS